MLMQLHNQIQEEVEMKHGVEKDLELQVDIKAKEEKRETKETGEE